MNATDKTYNGWKNYETWCVNLWVENDESGQRWAEELAEETYDEAEADDILTKSERARHELADAIKLHFEDDDQFPIQEASVYADLLRAALSEVDWLEIADNWLENCDDIEGYEPLND